MKKKLFSAFLQYISTFKNHFSGVNIQIIAENDSVVVINISWKLRKSVNNGFLLGE